MIDPFEFKKESFLCIIALIFLLLTACAPSDLGSRQSSVVTKESVVKTTSASEISELFGIEIIALRDTAAGHMLDFRFRVVDLEKAMPFFREDIKPYLVDQNSGKSLTVPVPAKLGPMRPTGRNPKEGVTYWMFFGNPGLIKPGDKVTIVIGDYRLEDLVVEGQ
jgi:hypothetical protein